MEVAIFIWLMFGIVAMIIASAKERSGCGWFILGCLFGPFSLVVAALPSNKTDPLAPSPDTHVKCPDCREYVLAEARVCKHCGCKLIPVSEQPVASKQPVSVKRTGVCKGCNRVIDLGLRTCAHCGTPTPD